MSGVENLDVMLGSYSRNQLEVNSDDRNDEVDLGSDRTRQDVVQNSEDFRSLSNSNSRENSESTIETVRLVNSEVSRKMEELKRDLNSQIAETINSLINERNLPNIQNTMTNQNSVFREEMDQRSGRLNRTAGEKNARNALKMNSKPILANSSRRDYFSGNSDVSQSSDEDHDILTKSHDTGLSKNSLYSAKTAARWCQGNVQKKKRFSLTPRRIAKKLLMLKDFELKIRKIFDAKKFEFGLLPKNMSKSYEKL